MKQQITYKVLNFETKWIPATLQLMDTKWGDRGATSDILHARAQYIADHSWICVNNNGDALATLFVMCTSKDWLAQGNNWYEITGNGTGSPHQSGKKIWFGISLTGIDSQAVKCVINSAERKMLRDGIRHIYLGSPMTGFKDWKMKQPATVPLDYARRKVRLGLRQLPLDPMLRYYYRYGFKTVKYVVKDYFPYKSSLDYGAIIHAHNPFWFAAPIFRRFMTQK